MNKRALFHPAKLPRHIRKMGYRFASISCVITLLIILLFFFSVRHNIITDIRADSISVLDNIEQTLQVNIDYSTMPLDVISHLPQSQHFLSNDYHSESLSAIFRTFLSESPFYLQLGLLDLAGIEQLKYAYREGNIIQIPKEQLRNQSNSFYYHALKNLEGNTVYISPLEYPMQKDSIEGSSIPTLHFAQTINSSDQKRLGYVIANVSANDLLNRIDQIHLFNYSHLYLVNSKGSVLYQSKGSKLPDNLQQPIELSSWQRINYGYVAKKTISLDTSHKTYEPASTWHLIYEITPQTLRYYENVFLVTTILCLFVLLPFVTVIGYTYGIHRASTQQYHRQLMIQATNDELTGLYNRRKIMRLLEKEMQNQKKEASSRLTIIFIDVNNLKYINDTYGHTMGDKMLQEATHVLLNALRSTDYLARLGGDEFLAVLPQCPHDCFIEDIIRRSDIAFRKAGIKYCSNEWVMSYGYTSYSPDDTIDTFIKRADHFMYRDKNKKKGLA